MQLAEVFDETQAPASPPPRKRRRLRWLLWLFALAAFGAALWVHGYGVTQVPANTALVITNDTGLSVFGPPVRVARRSKGLAIWAPIAQHAWRMSLRLHRPDAIAFSAQSKDGVTLPVRNATLSYRIDPAQAAQVFVKYGHRARAWDAMMRGELAWAWATVLARSSAAELAATPSESLVPAVRRVLQGRLDRDGLRIEAVSAARWQTPNAVEAGLAKQRRAHAELRRVQKATAAAIASASQDDSATENQWQTQRAEQAAILDATLQAARMQAAADVEDARRDAEVRFMEARAERAALMTRARAIEAIAPSDAEALATRTAALAEHGGRLLDEAILTHVLPQVDGAPPRAKDEDAP